MKRIITILFLCFSLSTYAQINVKDSLQAILQDESVDAETRFKNARNLIAYNNATPQEAEDLGLNVLYPFAQKQWKEKSKQQERLAVIYGVISYSYRERGKGDDKDEKERFFAQKALETAKKSGNDTVAASCGTVCGYMEIRMGNVKKGHEYLYDAIKHYDKAEMYVKASEMLYVIASNFFDIKDTHGMRRILQQMEEYLEKDTSKQSLYQYYVLKKSYSEMLLDRQKSDKQPLDCQLVDTTMFYVKKMIYLVENFLDELSPYWMHGYAYYYAVKAFDDYFPEQTDSIFFYLDKAFEMSKKETFHATIQPNALKEFYAYNNTFRAIALDRVGKTQEAYRVMSGVIVLLDELKTYGNLGIHRHRAYQFMADYYEKENRPVEALKYYKLLKESDEQRYENEKVQSINDMSVKYETEKKEIQIAALEKDKQAAQRILLLSVGLIAVLLISLLIFIRFYKLRKKNLEQSIYETALFAELKHNELEHNVKEKECLLQQYNDLELLSVHNKQMAQSYKDELKRIKQQLEQKPTKTMIGKLTEWLSKSVMDKAKKELYIKQLSDLDIEMLEQGYLCSDEKISNMEMKYIICFAIDMDVKDISLLFNVEPASIRTVRYRIKKKFGEKNTFKFLM